MYAHLPHPRCYRRWLIALALGAGGLFFVVPYVLRALFGLLQFTPALHSLDLLYEVLGNFSFFFSLFSEVWVYVLMSVVVIGLVLAALKWGRPGRVTRGLLLLTLLTTLVFPWFFHYETTVVAAAGHEMRWPTQPDLLTSVVKRAQISTEQRPCTYALLGWDTSLTLYYREVCGFQSEQTWAYNPNADAAARSVTTAPTDLTSEVRPHSQVLDLVRVASIYPPEAEPSIRSISVRDNGLTSPDGRWVALVARHVYGPEDVIVVSSVPIDHK